MKAVILAAGSPDQGDYGFPVGSKPKCLFHYNGEVLLERQVKVLRAVGLNDITVVVGHQKELIESFNSQKGLGLKIAYNPTGATDTKRGQFWFYLLDSLKVGIEGVDDDVIFIPGDVYLTEEGLRETLSHECSVLGLGGHGWQLFKVRRNVLPIIRKSDKTDEGFRPFRDWIMADGGITVKTNVFDVDWYSQTDEGKS